MPNIEIHGDLPFVIDEVKAHLRRCFEGASYFEDMVVEEYRTTVLDLRNYSKPYLRVACSPDGDLEDVLKRLEPLKMDIEVLALKQFIPAKA